MRLLVPFLLLCSICFSQTKNQHFNEFGLSVDSLIEGNWHHVKTEVENNSESNERYQLDNSSNASITFFGGKLKRKNQAVELFYRKEVDDFWYKIETDSLLKENYLIVFTKDKRNREHLIERYRIVKCSENCLVLSVSEMDKLTGNWFMKIQTFNKETDLSVLNKLKTCEWQTFSKNYIQLLSENPPLRIEFSNFEANSKVADSLSRTMTLKFDNSDEGNFVEITSSSKYTHFVDGVIQPVSFFLDSKQQLIYFDDESKAVYRIEFISSEKLILVFQKSLTDKRKLIGY